MKRWFNKKAATPVSSGAPAEAANPANSSVTQAQALQRNANELRSRGDLANALKSYQAAMALDSSYAPARLGAGLIKFDQQHYSTARELFEEAHRLQPGAVDAIYFLAQCDEMLGDSLAALKSYQQALSINPTFSPALSALAPLAVRLGRAEAAKRHLEMALDATPQDLSLHLLLGITLYASGQHRDSIPEFDLVLASDPDRLEALINKAEALMSLDKTDEALRIIDHLNALAARRPEVMLLSARALFNNGALEQAAAKAEELLSVDSGSAMAEYVLGLVQWARDDAASAKHHCQRALQLDPDLSGAGLWVATLLFFLKDYKAAWPAYEARFGPSFGSLSADSLLLRRLGGGKRWSGESDPAGTLYIWGEQGFGDNLMLLPMVARAAAQFQGTVYFFCPRALHRLAQQIIPIQFLLASRDEIPDLALHCPLYGLPVALEQVTHSTFVPSARPAYLRAPQAAVDRFQQRLAQLTGFKVGVIWDGAGAYKANLQRNVPLSLFSVIAAIPGVTLVSLQKDPPAADLANCTFLLHDWTDEIADFGDTAGIMQGLDLVISIDSGPAHLAGALGVPVWLMNRYDGEWRWGRARRDNDWYQSLRVFYQSRRGDWPAVFASMADQLSRLVNRG